jgi:hypothetical protein
MYQPHPTAYTVGATGTVLVQLHVEGNVQSPFINGQEDLSNLDATVKPQIMTLINMGGPEGPWRTHLDDKGTNPKLTVGANHMRTTLLQR